MYSYAFNEMLLQHTDVRAKKKKKKLGALRTYYSYNFDSLASCEEGLALIQLLSCLLDITSHCLNLGPDSHPPRPELNLKLNETN